MDNRVQQYWSNRYGKVDSKNILVSKLLDKQYIQKELNSIMPLNSLIELGCGRGRFFDCYKNIKNVYAVDITEKALILAMKKGFKYNFKLLDIANEKMDLKFDCIVSSQLLLHIEPERALKAFVNMFKMLKKGGYMIHITWWDQYQIDKKGKLDTKNFKHGRNSFSHDYLSIFKALKLEIIKIEKIVVYQDKKKKTYNHLFVVKRTN